MQRSVDTYLIKDHCRVERMANGISLHHEFGTCNCQRCHDRPYFRNLSYFFSKDRLSHLLQPKFYYLINLIIFRFIYIYIYNFLKAMRNENVILLTIFIIVKSGLMIRVFETFQMFFFFYCNWTYYCNASLKLILN